MNPPENIKEYRQRKEALGESTQGNPGELIDRNKLMKRGAAAIAAGAAIVGLAFGPESGRVADPKTSAVEFVHNGEGTFLQHRVEPGETIWEVARAFQQSVPELEATDTREIVDKIVADQDGESVIYPDQQITFQISDNPENPTS